MGARLFAGLICATFTLASVGCERAYDRQQCRMLKETVLASTGATPTSVSVTALSRDGFAAAWASDNATWHSTLDAEGTPLTPPKRITGQETASIIGGGSPLSGKTFWPEADRSSLAAEDLVVLEQDEDSRLIFALVRPNRDTRGGVYAALSTADEGAPGEVLRIASAGEYAGRISAAAHGDEVVVAWHEGRLDVSRVHVARLTTTPLKVQSTRALGDEYPTFYPSVTQLEGVFYVTWSEITREQANRASTVKVATLTKDLDIKDLYIAHRGALLETAPELATAGNAIGLLFRDDRDLDSIPEYYFTRVDKNLKPLREPRRISQADGWNGPSLAYLGTRFVATAIRSFQRNLLIGLNHFDLGGTKLGGEFQVYADKSDFVRVDVAVKGPDIMMIYAEDRRGSGRILAAQVRCKNPR